MVADGYGGVYIGRGSSGTRLPAGLYFVGLDAGSARLTRRLVLLD